MKTIEEIKASGRDKKTGRFLRSHGKSTTRLYSIFIGVKRRCYDPKRKEFPKYGGRGILMCEEWHNDFLSFYLWAINNGYADNLTLDRIDNDKGYSPDNCRWVDRRTQTLNRRITKFIELDDKKYTVPELARMNGKSKDLYYARARKYGYTSEILKETETPKYLYFGKYYTLSELAAICNISIQTLSYRLKHGWKMELLAKPTGKKAAYELAGEKFEEYHTN